MIDYTPVKYSEVSTQKYTLRDLLLILFRRKFFVLGLSLPIILLGLYGTITNTATYMASSEVLIEARAIENPTFGRQIVEYDILMNTVAEIAQSIPVARLTAKAVMDSLAVFQHEGSVLAEISTEEEMLDVVMGGTNCGQVGESNILSIGFSHENAEFAVFAVGCLTEAFMVYSVESQKNTSAQEYYAEQIELVSGEIEYLLSERVKVFSEGGLAAFKANNESGIQQMRSVEYTYLDTRSRREEFEDRYLKIVEAIEENENYLPSLTTAAQTASIIDAKGSLDKAVRDLAKLRLTYQDSSQYVQRQLAYVETNREMYNEVRDDFVTDLRISLENVRAKERSLLSSLEGLRERLLEFPELEKRLYSLDLQISTKRDLLESLQMKHGEVRLKTDSDKRVSNIVQLNEPSVNIGVAGSKKIIYLFITVVLAIVLGIVVALLVDFQDHRIYDRRQAESILELPVLGAISPSEAPVVKL